MNTNALEQYRKKATEFALEWAKERDEKGEAHSFWDAFFRIFDLERRHFARHESRVSRVGKGKGFIDLFWPGKLLVEHKSAHKNRPEDWADTLQQALDYISELDGPLRPKRVVLCNFKRFQIYDVSQGLATLAADFNITELPQQIAAFEFVPRFAGQIFEEEETANLRAIEYMAAVHDVLQKSGYRGRNLELLLVRVLFCLFAEDTGIFEHKQFSKFIEHDTLDNGSDIGDALMELFAVLDSPMRARGEHVQGRLRQFPYVNGGLFAEPLSTPPPSLTGIRNVLLNCAPFDWSEISPEIFGSLFQAVLSSTERRSLGAHFTSERNIRRLIEPLFLRELWAELAEARQDDKKLDKLRRKIGQLQFLDPACGCGNFLVVTYRELRLLDAEILKLQFAASGQYVVDIGAVANVRLDQMHGLEIKPVSALIAQTALWLTDHQCNRLLQNTVGVAVPSIPLAKTTQIHTGNALQIVWASLLPEGKVYDFIIGNPPFIGSKIMDDVQREEIKFLFGNESGSGTLDYVTGWYIKAAKYMDENHQTTTAFVSTNSIAQGEQVGMLWGMLMGQYSIKIRFAHQTFKWTNEAPGIAAVYCIIVGFGKRRPKNCLLFEYPNIKEDPIENVVKNINPYLVEAGDVVARSRQKPLCDVPEIGIGNKPIDGGHYLFETQEKEEFLKKEPRAAAFFKRWIGSDEFINGWERWCLWLGETDEETLRQIPLVWERVEAVRQTRLASKSAPTQKLAEKPTRFHVENMPRTNYLVIPEVSSERRIYIPIGYELPTTLASNLVKIVADADLLLFGILISEMHMAWVRYVAGRLKSDYRYSKDIVYNNFPFPTSPTATQRTAVEVAAQAVLDIRVAHAPKSLAELYDPNKMPADLLAAHKALDLAVDAAYGLKRPFATEAKRVAWLFERYGELVGNGK